MNTVFIDLGDSAWTNSVNTGCFLSFLWTVKRLELLTGGLDVQAFFKELWLQNEMLFVQILRRKHNFIINKTVTTNKTDLNASQNYFCAQILSQERLTSFVSCLLTREQHMIWICLHFKENIRYGNIKMQSEVMKEKLERITAGIFKWCTRYQLQKKP